MARLIPKKTKVRVKFYKNMTLMDAVLLFVGIVIVGLILLSGLHSTGYILAAIVATLFGCMFINVAPETRLYQSIGYSFKYIFTNKLFVKKDDASAKSVNLLTPYDGIIDYVESERRSSDVISYIDYGEYYGGVIELRPVQFYMLSEQRQNSFITAVDNALKTISAGQVVSLVKTSRPLNLDSFIENEKQKTNDIITAVDNDSLSETELDPRLDIIESRVVGLENCNIGSPNEILKDHYYMVIYGSSKEVLKGTLNLVVNTIEGGTGNTLQCDILNAEELAVFLKSTVTDKFDEREVKKLARDNYLDWILPDKIKFSASKYFVDNQAHTSFVIADYPLAARNAWGNYFFDIPGTTVVVKFKPVDISTAEHRIDTAIMEMEAQHMQGGKSSKMLQIQTHIDTLNELLVGLKNGNEGFFDTSIIIHAKDEVKKNVKTMLRRGGFKYNELFFAQQSGFIAGNISRRMELKKYDRGINSSSLAAIFPFISDAIQDPKGFFIGYNSEPIFLDLFKRDKERINSNMVILGKSGSGKSFATKGMLAHLAADNCKIYVLDPEKEYDMLVKNLGGKMIDVGSARQGRLNPFQVFTTLDDDDESGLNTSLATHLQFLEEFFKIILDGITKDALEILNDCVRQVYEKMGINNNTEIQDLKPEDFPIFQDVYEFIKELYDKTKDEFYKSNLRIIITYLNKFVEGGRNSILWNGYSSISTEENFVVFNFQTLLANKNNDIANAQMLLTLRWLDNEIVKNKDYNFKYNTNRRIVVAIDEAHVFIDPKKDIALDFMYNLAKRIRKYNGMQIVITQNLKDFVGTPEIARKSTAIINASQYSFIFSLAPHDINDLVELYEKAGRINESEQDAIVSAPRGRAFVITSPYSRTNVDVAISDIIRDTFEKDLAVLRRDAELEEQKLNYEVINSETDKDFDEYEETVEEVETFDTTEDFDDLDDQTN